LATLGRFLCVVYISGSCSPVVSMQRNTALRAKAHVAEEERVEAIAERLLSRVGHLRDVSCARVGRVYQTEACTGIRSPVQEHAASRKTDRRRTRRRR
jgi:hypothetical protein